jgi:GntR family transcriptional regulator/MocR family aminotransferase
LRHALADYLSFARGLKCSADEIIVCAGTAETVRLLSAALNWPGRRVGVENPGYAAIRNVLHRIAVEWVPIDATDPATMSEQLESMPPLSGLYLTPNHQYPLGHRLDEALRRTLIDWADHTDTVIVEDDYDGEFYFGIAPSTSMAGLSPTSNVVFVGAMSKVLDPGLRLAFMRVPPQLLNAVHSARDDFGPTVPTAIQHGIAAFIASGELSRHIARARRTYADRRRAMLQELRTLTAVKNLVGIEAGLHVVAELAPTVDVVKVISEALQRGIALENLDDLRCGPTSGPPGLVLGYSGYPVAGLRRAMAVLRECPELGSG